MTLVTWVLLTMVIFFAICAFYAWTKYETEKQDRKEAEHTAFKERQRATYYQKLAGLTDAKHTEFFDFEKVNGKKEK